VAWVVLSKTMANFIRFNFNRSNLNFNHLNFLIQKLVFEYSKKANYFNIFIKVLTSIFHLNCSLAIFSMYMVIKVIKLLYWKLHLLEYHFYINMKNNIYAEFTILFVFYWQSADYFMSKFSKIFNWITISVPFLFRYTYS
jgi:hypothetical protein